MRHLPPTPDKGVFVISVIGGWIAFSHATGTQYNKTLSYKKTQVAQDRSRVANVVLYFGTHLEPQKQKAQRDFR